MPRQVSQASQPHYLTEIYRGPSLAWLAWTARPARPSQVSQASPGVDSQKKGRILI